MNKPVTIPLSQPSAPAASDDRVYLKLVGKDAVPAEPADKLRAPTLNDDLADEVEDLWDNVPI